MAHLLNLLDDERGLHEPCQHGVQAEDHLRVFRHSAQRSYKAKEILTANPTRVAMDELQLHDLQNIDAGGRVKV